MTASTDLLLRPVGPAMKSRISNFGIELEVLPQGCGTGRFTGRRRDNGCCDECHYWSDCCQASEGCDDGGCSCHDESGDGSGQPYIDAFVTAGLMSSSDTDQHSYHCDCSRCSYGRDFPHFTAQEDCTVGIEFVSRILSAERDLEVVEAAVEAHEAGMVACHWRPDGVGSFGNHIHVSRSGTDGGQMGFRRETQTQAKALIGSLFGATSFEMVASGGCGRLRGYNGSKPQKAAYDSVLHESGWSSWLSQKGSGGGTIEIRVWNTPAVAERIKAHVGLSLGLTRWAFGQVIHDRMALREQTNGWMVEQMAKRREAIAEVILDAVPARLREQSALALEAWTS